MQDRRLRAAVVGCGGGGRTNHIPWLSMNPQVELAAVMDASEDVRDQIAPWCTNFYTDLDEMLDKETLDLAAIATPVHLHCRQTLKCLDHGCHVLCEKPMAPSIRECRAMLDRAETAGLILGMGLDKRFSPGASAVRDLVASGRIGKVFFIKVILVMSQGWVGTDHDPGFRGKVHTGGGAFQDLGSHYLDMFSWVSGREITAIQGHCDIICPEKMEVEDHAVALLRMQDGVKGLIEASWVGPMDEDCMHVEEFWVYGSRGVIRAEGSQRLEPNSVKVWDRSANQWSTHPQPCDPGTFGHYQYKRMVDHFVDCVRRNKPFEPSGAAGAKSIDAILGFYRSAVERKEIALPLGEDIDLAATFEAIRNNR